MTFDLPEPPSRRTEDRLHWAVKRQLVFDTKKAIWRAAIDQHTPLADPPQKVRVSVHFRLHNADDEDNLYTRSKRLLDALKQKHTAHDSLSWRYAPDIPVNWITRGYFFDDDPDHLELGSITQEIDRKSRGTTLTIEVL